jgi:hypothetical protein
MVTPAMGRSSNSNSTLTGQFFGVQMLFQKAGVFQRRHEVLSMLSVGVVAWPPWLYECPSNSLMADSFRRKWNPGRMIPSPGPMLNPLSRGELGGFALYS